MLERPAQNLDRAQGARVTTLLRIERSRTLRGRDVRCDVAAPICVCYPLDTICGRVHRSGSRTTPLTDWVEFIDQTMLNHTKPAVREWGYASSSLWLAADPYRIRTESQPAVAFVTGTLTADSVNDIRGVLMNRTGRIALWSAAGVLTIGSVAGVAYAAGPVPTAADPMDAALQTFTVDNQTETQEGDRHHLRRGLHRLGARTARRVRRRDEGRHDQDGRRSAWRNHRC